VFAALPVDTVPPTSQASVSPAARGGWNNSNVTVSLSATDTAQSGVTPSGVKNITYSATGAQTIGNTSLDGASASFPVTTDGTTTVSFFAADNAGNVETARTLIIKLDKASPSVSISGFSPNGSNGWFKTAPATGTATATDPTPSSGVHSIDCTDNLSATRA